MSAGTVVLLTDFGHRDPFVGIMKGVMLGINPALQLVDLSHEIRPQCIGEAAIILASSYAYFPPATIFLVVVDPGVGGSRRPLVVATATQRFVAPDNGVLGPTLDQAEVRHVIHATASRYFRQPVSHTFHGRDVFAPLAAWLSLGTPACEMGPSIDEYQRLVLPQPGVDAAEALIGEVIYQDRFGNLITNIGETLATPIWGPAPWQGVEASLETSRIRGLNSHYAERAPQELGLIINSWGLFEVFATNASAARLTGAVEGSPVRIRRSGR